MAQKNMNSGEAVLYENVVKAFPGTLALNGFSLSVPQKSFFCLLGANGAGKTTALRMLTGLAQPDAGEITIFGRSIASEPELVKQDMAFLPDEPFLYGRLKPLEYLEFVSGLWKVPSHTAERRAEDLLKQLDLWQHNGKLIESFSRGMQQKLALIGALIHDPKLMVLDEPLTGLDIVAARQIKDILQDSVTAGMTIVLTTHVMEVAERLATRIGIIKAGRLIACGAMDDLRERYEMAPTSSLEDVYLKSVGALV